MEHLTERERSGDKPKSTNKPLPKDAQVIMSIMKQMHVNNYDQRVINQLLEFTYSKCFCREIPKFQLSIEIILFSSRLEKY